MVNRTFLVAILTSFLLLVSGCASVNNDGNHIVESEPPVLGEKVAVPMGYVFHCIDYPDSIFCVQKEEEKEEEKE